MRFDFIDRAVRGRRHQAAVGGEEVELEVVERNLREVIEEDRQLSRRRVRTDRSDQLCVDAEAGGDEEKAVLVSGPWFADVDGAVERAGQCLGADRERS